MNMDDDLNPVLSTLNPFGENQFDDFFCEECNLPLKDYGCEPLIFGEVDSFSDRLLCYKCAADFFGEEDYHSERLTDNEISFVELDFNEEMKKTTCDVLKSLALGMTEKEILENLPHLNHKDILACYDFAAQ